MTPIEDITTALAGLENMAAIETAAQGLLTAIKARFAEVDTAEIEDAVLMAVHLAADLAQPESPATHEKLKALGTRLGGIIHRLPMGKLGEALRQDAAEFVDATAKAVSDGGETAATAAPSAAQTASAAPATSSAPATGPTANKSA